MKIGIPRETKVHEYRVALVPAAVRELVDAGHEVLVERGAGAGIDFGDERYRDAGARVVGDAAALFAEAALVVKVKEPSLEECARLRPGQVLFTYLHLAANAQLTGALLDSGAAAIAYETVTAADGSLPLLVPMSEVAGRMSVQVGAACLQAGAGGRGVLIGGVPGVPAADVVILGGGVAGSNAAQMALGLGAEVTVIDRSMPRLRALSVHWDGRLKTLYPTAETVEALVTEADLVIGAVLVPGARAPRLVTRSLLGRMRAGAVLVDVSIDQGGCFETSRPTTHAEPTYVLDRVVHYCVSNMPGAVPRTSAVALGNVTLPFVQAIAARGWRAAMAADPHLARGLNVSDGAIVHPAVAESLGRPCRPLEQVLGAH